MGLLDKPKQPYLYFCTICGTQFKPFRSHARTCSDECRVVLSGMKRRGIDEVPEHQRTPINKDAVQEKYRDASGGKDIQPGILNQYPEKPKGEGDTPIGKLTHAAPMTQPAAPVDPIPPGEPTPEPEPTKPAKKKAKKKK